MFGMKDSYQYIFINNNCYKDDPSSGDIKGLTSRKLLS